MSKEDVSIEPLNICMMTRHGRLLLRSSSSSHEWLFVNNNFRFVDDAYLLCRYYNAAFYFGCTYDIAITCMCIKSEQAIKNAIVSGLLRSACIGPVRDTFYRNNVAALCAEFLLTHTYPTYDIGSELVAFLGCHCDVAVKEGE